MMQRDFSAHLFMEISIEHQNVVEKHEAYIGGPEAARGALRYRESQNFKNGKKMPFFLACEARYRNHVFSTNLLQKSLDLVVFCLD